MGTIIVATGFDPSTPTLKPELGYGLYENVITGLEFERLVIRLRPHLGPVPINGKKPKEGCVYSVRGLARQDRGQ